MSVSTSSDLLCITARQLIEWPLSREALQVIDIEEKMAAPALVMIRRAALPLRPAAEYLPNMFRRASVSYAAAPGGKTGRRKAV
ncbi:MAG: hypothetical protein ACREVR_19840 [Burkholderiales bacterium]